MKDITDFFFFANEVPDVTENDYQKTVPLIDTLDTLTRMTYQSWYVIDYHKRNFLYVSKNPLILCGQTPAAVKESGLSFILQHVPEAEIDMLREISRAVFELYTRIPVEDRKEYTLSFDYHILTKNQKKLINQKLTPLLLAGNGAVWLAACVVSRSSHREEGHIKARKSGSSEYWTYSLERHRWEQSDAFALNDREKEVLLLAAQGYTMNDIAKTLCLSVDTVKFYKRTLFDHLDVHSVVAALSAATNYKMI